MLYNPSPEQRLVHQLVETVRALPNISVGPPRWNGARGTQVDLHIKGKLVTLQIEAKNGLYPRDVREILWRLRPPSKSLTHEADAMVSVLVADSISPGAKDLLKEEHIGYFDSGGSLYLPAPGAYIFIDKPPPQGLPKSIGPLVSGARSQVLHALLHQYREWVGGEDLARQAETSPTTVSQVLMELERLEFVESRGQGPHKERHVTQPGALLDYWVKHLAVKRAPVLRRYFVPSLKTNNLLPLGQALSVHRVVYAISYEAGAQHYAPFITTVSQVRMRALVSPATEAAIAALQARSVDEGANLTIIDAKSSGEFLFSEQAGGLSWSNPIQVYLDLQRSEGRSREMAEHLRRERIGF
jgi:hypothetical protein